MSQRVKIDSLSSEGDGVGSLKGLKVFVEGALPGEEAEVELTLLKKNYGKAKLLSLVTPSPHRVEPLCPLFGTCGGCQWMHLSYEEQIKAKRLRVEEALKRIGGIDHSVEECVASPASFGYRNKIQLPVVWEQETMKIGLYKRDSHEIVPVEKCLIQSVEGEELLKEMIPRLQKERSVRTLLLRTAARTGEALVIVVTKGGLSAAFGQEILKKHPSVKGVVENIKRGEDNVILGREWRTLAGKPFFHERLLGKTFRISAGSFFQVNTELAEKLFHTLLTLAALKKTDVVWDAYCGVGTGALLAAEHVKEVIGSEVAPQAIEDAKANSTLNGISNALFKVGKAEEVIRKVAPCTVVFLNPPRKGCAEELLREIGERGIERILYVSCDPATLARDLKFLSTYNYRIERILPFDMFPQTAHVETVVALHKS